MDLYLIRHGESTQNTKDNFRDKLPDHMVSLTNKGINQCIDAGAFLKGYLEENDINICNSVL